MVKKTTRYDETKINMMKQIANMKDQSQSEALREALDQWLSLQLATMDETQRKMVE